MKRQPPDHGTQARYKGSKTRPPCRCRRCIRAHSRACATRALAHLAGTPPKVPAQPVTEHIQRLRGSGMSYSAIATLAHVTESIIRDHAAGKWPTIQRGNAARILATRPGWQTDHGDKSMLVPAIGSMRRIQALFTIGHGTRAIAAESGTSQSFISGLAHERFEIVNSRKAHQIRVAYKALVATPGDSRRAISVSRQHGWYGPLAWGSDIDDPAATPDVAGVASLSSGRGSKRDDTGLVAEEIRHLAAGGVPVREIAVRVSRTEKYVRELLAGHRGPGWRQRQAA